MNETWNLQHHLPALRRAATPPHSALAIPRYQCWRQGNRDSLALWRRFDISRTSAAACAHHQRAKQRRARMLSRVWDLSGLPLRPTTGTVSHTKDIWIMDGPASGGSSVLRPRTFRHYMACALRAPRAPLDGCSPTPLPATTTATAWTHILPHFIPPSRQVGTGCVGSAAPRWHPPRCTRLWLLLPSTSASTSSPSRCWARNALHLAMQPARASATDMTCFRQRSYHLERSCVSDWRWRGAPDTSTLLVDWWLTGSLAARYLPHHILYHRIRGPTRRIRPPPREHSGRGMRLNLVYALSRHRRCIPLHHLVHCAPTPTLLTDISPPPHQLPPATHPSTAQRPLPTHHPHRRFPYAPNAATTTTGHYPSRAFCGLGINPAFTLHWSWWHFPIPLFAPACYRAALTYRYGRTPAAFHHYCTPGS